MNQSTYNTYQYNNKYVNGFASNNLIKLNTDIAPFNIDSFLNTCNGSIESCIKNITPNRCNDGTKPQDVSVSGADFVQTNSKKRKYIELY